MMCKYKEFIIETLINDSDLYYIDQLPDHIIDDNQDYSIPENWDIDDIADCIQELIDNKELEITDDKVVYLAD